jgi:hypothetical protein
VALLANNMEAVNFLLTQTKGMADLSYCELKRVPDSVVNLVNEGKITKLIMRGNHLQYVPLEICEKLRSRDSVDLGSNPLTANFGDKWSKQRKNLISQLFKPLDTIREKQGRVIIFSGTKQSGKTSLCKVKKKDSRFFFIVN